MKNKKKKLLIAYSLVAIVLFVAGIKCIKNAYTTDSLDAIHFNKNSDISYRVYLKENEFFENEYLGMDEIYITSIIDYLDVDFDYSMVLDTKRNGSYKYTVYALISADTVNSSGNYWNKKYVLSEEQIKNVDNQEVINIHENVKVDYQKYNDILMAFKKEYNLNMDGTLKIFLQVDENFEGEKPDSTLTSNSMLMLSIPLTKATIEVPIEVTKPSGNGTIIENNAKDSKKVNTIGQIFGYISLIIATLLIIYITLIIVKNTERSSVYNKKIKKITKTYDGIIVNVEKLPKLDNINVIDVENFSELLDAHSEIRLPINFKYTESVSTFILIDKNIAWRYVLKKEGEYL